ncbi:MAG: thioredoxin family protein [SAR202 cluster bacterium]|nr:thioredoxin family protein [SAR202 cluster bacterium]
MKLRNSIGFAVCAALAGMLAAAACGGNGAAQPSPSVNVTATRPEATQTPGTPSAQPAQVQVALAASDFGVGVNRIPFGIIELGVGPVRDGEVWVSSYYLLGNTQEGPIDTVEAEFRTWPAGPGGVFVASLNFDRPGDWGIGVTVSENGNTTKIGSVRVQVNPTSFSPGIGTQAPASENKTAADVGGLEELTTDPNPDPALYEMTIAEALQAGRPLLVVFATPAYCQTATCGPQVDVVKHVKERHGDEMNFIHIEVYDNPLEIQGDLSRARVSPILTEWNLPSEPWTFVMDADGTIRAKFEGFATEAEIEEALQNVLGS